MAGFKLWVAGVLALGTAFAAVAGEKTPIPQEKPANAVQAEMRLLQAVMETAVGAIARGDVRGLPPLLHRVHMAADKTKSQTAKGDYRPPKNANKLDQFNRLDRGFHQEMLKMVKAAKKNNVDEVARSFADLMIRCQGCHRVYR